MTNKCILTHHMIGEKDYWLILLGYIYIVLDNTPYIAIVFHNFS